jgi:hypothetical protein
VDDNDMRREMVYNLSSLREAFFRYMSERFAGASWNTQMHALKVSANITDLFYHGTNKNVAVSLLRDGALNAVKQAAFHVFELGRDRGSRSDGASVFS